MLVNRCVLSVSLILLYYFTCDLFVHFFFFKQKTAYEMRISDWSSDVCSSDLAFPFALRTARRLPADHKCTPFRDRTEAGPRERLSKPHANSNFLASDHIS